uniref:Uncharacterized protein n=1 Tax=Lactuca sativa TaxID=4236 RepID=A0A9R1WYS4_LACSA|nr:hypothetical protein LSAT_V11C800412950 [Lactuca sativa]
MEYHCEHKKDIHKHYVCIPSIFELEVKCIVAYIKFVARNSWNWISCHEENKSSHNLGIVLGDIIPFRLELGINHWCCKMTSDGNYVVNNVICKIDQQPHNIPGTSQIK